MKKVIFSAVLAAVVFVITMFIRIPIPRTGGYLNLGDVLVLFGGLYLGPRWGTIAGGVGSAIADLVGFPVFAPYTLVVKALEGFLAGALRKKAPWLGCLLGALIMVGGYFLTEAVLLAGAIGLSAAVVELPFNLFQGAVGVLGALAVWKATRDNLPKLDD